MVDMAGLPASSSRLTTSLDDFYANTDGTEQQQPHHSHPPLSPNDSGSASAACFSAAPAVQRLPPDPLDSAAGLAAGPKAATAVSFGGDSSGNPTSSFPGLSGSLDSYKAPRGAKFAVSQLHGVYLAVHRLVLSRCAPWGEFASLPSFQRPGSGAAAVDRMERNLKYFRVNYVCVCSALGVVCALLNPSALLIGAVCGALCAVAAAKGEIQVGDTVVPQRSFQLAVCLCGGCFLFLLAGNAVITSLVLCAILVCIHSALHRGVSYEVIAQKNESQQNGDLGV